MSLHLKNSDTIYDTTSTYAFCVMPDHVHWLFQLKSKNLSQCIAGVKARFSKDYKKKIWQDGYHEHAIRTDETLINVARYIVANPLRANLVKDIGSYPFWDCIWLDPI